MITIAILQEIADAGGPAEWLELYWPEADDVPTPCYDGCDCRCERDYAEHLSALALAAAIKAQLAPETVTAIEARVTAQLARAHDDLAMLNAIDAMTAAAAA